MGPHFSLFDWNAKATSQTPEKTKPSAPMFMTPHPMVHSPMSCLGLSYCNESKFKRTWTPVMEIGVREGLWRMLSTLESFFIHGCNVSDSVFRFRSL